MTTADWALIISLGSLFVSLSGFVWSIWAKFIYPKPKVKTNMSVMCLYYQDNGPRRPCISLHATNFGPIDVTLKHAIVRKKERIFTHRRDFGLLNPYNNYPNDLTSNGPFGGGLPKKLAVGEEFSVYFPKDVKWFENDELADIGFIDTFGRYHKCAKSDVNKVKKSVLESHNEE